MATLKLDSNRLTGTIPAWNVPSSLTLASLHDNELTGAARHVRLTAAVFPMKGLQDAVAANLLVLGAKIASYSHHQ